MKTNNVEYMVDGKRFVGYLADGSGGKVTAGVLVAHEGGGMTEHPKERARMLAELGYVAFAMDTFGETIGSIGQSMAHINELLADLPGFRMRSRAALELLKAHNHVDPGRTAAIGFCFGGTTVLELARSGAEVQCVVGFHSGLETSAPQDARNIQGAVLVCLGAKDPLVSAAHREAFVKEMEDGGVNWEMALYGSAGHSFTNREVDAMNLPGFAYDQLADERSWIAMRTLFDRVLGPV